MGARGTLQSPSAANADEDARARFLDEAGHELRTPITALKGQIQLMQRRLRKESDDRERDLTDLDKMLYHIERLNHQLDVFLSATHITQKRYTVVTAPCDIVAVARRLVAVYSAGVSGHTIRFESAEDELIGEWDRRRLDEALSVLLTNAIKYSRGGEVTLSISRKGDTAHVEVSDEGPGIPAHERTAIFRQYVTGSAVENAGSGLGLFVAREAIRRQHGRIGVRARRGKGSTFWFEVPLTQPVAKRRRTAAPPAEATVEATLAAVTASSAV
jgi:signal transduction histidine kinase